MNPLTKNLSLIITTQISDNTSRNTSTSTNPLETSFDTSLSSPDVDIAEYPSDIADVKAQESNEIPPDEKEMEAHEAEHEEPISLLEDNARLQAENAVVKGVCSELEQRNVQLEVQAKEQLQLQEENTALKQVWWELEQKNTSLEVQAKEHLRLINLHIDLNNVVETTNDVLKSQLAQMRQDAFDDIKMLRQQTDNLEITNDALEQRIGLLGDELSNRDVRIGNYEMLFQRYKTEWTGVCEKHEELQKVIQAFPDHPRALLEAVTKRDERIARLKDIVKENRVCDKALKQAYLIFAAKYNNVVGLANDRLEVGVMLSRRLAQVEAYLLQEGHASPIVDREQVWNEVWTVFRINENGLWEENEAGQLMIVLKEDEVADKPDGWLPGFLKQAWMEEGEVVEDDLNTSTGEGRNNTCNAEGHETPCVDERQEATHAGGQGRLVELVDAEVNTERQSMGLLEYHQHSETNNDVPTAMDGASAGFGILSTSNFSFTFTTPCSSDNNEHGANDGNGDTSLSYNFFFTPTNAQPAQPAPVPAPSPATIADPPQQTVENSMIPPITEDDMQVPTTSPTSPTPAHQESPVAAPTLPERTGKSATHKRNAQRLRSKQRRRELLRL